MMWYVGQLNLILTLIRLGPNEEGRHNTIMVGELSQIKSNPWLLV